jgi:hypothetical protein
MKLFHVSDNAAISVFEPRPAPGMLKAGDLAVWAISEDKLANYLLPRDCPRVCFATRSEFRDAAPLLPLRSAAPRVIAIESAWFERACAATLFLYEMPGAAFSHAHQDAGYWIAREPIVPVSVTKIAHPILALLQTGAELRVLPSLWELHDAAIAAGTVFSMIRMRNAKPRGNA